MIWLTENGLYFNKGNISPCLFTVLMIHGCNFPTYIFCWYLNACPKCLLLLPTPLSFHYYVPTRWCMSHVTSLHTLPSNVTSNMYLVSPVSCPKCKLSALCYGRMLIIGSRLCKMIALILYSDEITDSYEVISICNN